MRTIFFVGYIIVWALGLVSVQILISVLRRDSESEWQAMGKPKNWSPLDISTSLKLLISVFRIIFMGGKSKAISLAAYGVFLSTIIIGVSIIGMVLKILFRIN